MKDLLDSLGEHLKDRFSSPLAGAFIVSWLLWNYKVIFTLFSDMKPWVKFGFISDHIWTDPLVTGIHVLIGPAATAIFYILFYPYPARWVWAYNAKHKRMNEMQRQLIDEETPLTAEAAEILKANLRKQLDVMQAENRQLNNTLAEYRSAQQSVDDAVNAYKQENSGLRVSVGEFQTALEVKEQELRRLHADVERILSEHRLADVNLSAAVDRENGLLEQVNTLAQERDLIARDRGRVLEVLDLALKEVFPNSRVDISKINGESFESNLAAYKKRKSDQDVYDAIRRNNFPERPR